jgi:hypothetical protein
MLTYSPLLLKQKEKSVVLLQVDRGWLYSDITALLQCL